MNVLAGSTLGILGEGLFALVFGVIGAVLIFLYFRNKNKAKASEGWPSTYGRIVSNDVSVSYQNDDDYRRVSYLPKVQFTYQVGGESFTGKRIAFGSDPDFNTRRKATNFLLQYPVGAEVAVFFNPENPSEAVLSQKMRSMTAGLIVGIVMLVIMVCALCPVLMAVVRLIGSLGVW